MKTRQEKLNRIAEIKSYSSTREQGITDKEYDEIAEIEESMIQQFYLSIRWDQLKSHICTILGLADNEIILTTELFNEKRAVGRFRVRFSSNNLSHKCGMLSTANVYETLVVDTFGGNYFVDGDSGDEMYWFNPHISFQYKVGGSNGHSLFDAYWNMTKNMWLFK